MSEYSNYKLGKVDLETEKAYLAIIEEFTEKEIWIPKTVVGSDKRIKKWFIEQKDKEMKDYMKRKKQSDLNQFF